MQFEEYMRSGEESCKLKKQLELWKDEMIPVVMIYKFLVEKQLRKWVIILLTVHDSFDWWFPPYRQFIGSQFSLLPSPLNTLFAVTNPSLLPWNHVTPP